MANALRAQAALAAGLVGDRVATTTPTWLTAT